VRYAGMVSYGRGAPLDVRGEDIEADVVEVLANAALEQPSRSIAICWLT